MSAETVPPNASAPAHGASPLTRIGLLLFAIALLVVVAVIGVNWWTHGRFVEATNDAYLQADQVTVSPKISGYVDALFVVDNQAVTAGQPLLRIDARSYGALVAQQAAAVDARKADLAAARQQVVQQQASIEQSQAQLAGAQANAEFSAREAERFRILSDQGVETQDRSAQADNARLQALATLRASAAGVRIAQRQIAALKTQVSQAQAQVEAATASARSAQLNLGDTLIRASIAGRVGDKTVRLGQFVEPGTRMMSIVPVDNLYLVANFKETQIGHMHVGQAVKVRLDALGDQTIGGVIDSFAPGTGAQFALLPPENATGNFTKVVQRVPVRIRLNPPANLRDHLLPGLSATVTVDTRETPEPAS